MSVIWLRISWCQNADITTSRLPIGLRLSPLDKRRACDGSSIIYNRLQAYDSRLSGFLHEAGTRVGAVPAMLAIDREGGAPADDRLDQALGE